MKFHWKGVMPAVTTKFTQNDELDLEMFRVNLEAQKKAGVSGIIIGGSLGEASTLEPEEKIKLTDVAKEVGNKEIPIIMNIAESSTNNAIKAAQIAQHSGIDGLMVLPPLKYKATDEETVQWFRSIASETDLPIMVYNNPVDYKIEVSIPMFEQLLKVPNITAVKESTRDVSNVTRLRNAFGDNLKILCGVDTLAMESILMGADGWVAGLVCAFPRETVAVYELVQQNRILEARDIYRWFLPLLELDIDPQLVQNIKLAEEATGIGTVHVRPPRMPLSGSRKNEVLEIIKKGIENRPIIPQL